MLRLIFSSLILVALYFGYSNFSTIGDTYYDGVDEGSSDMTSQVHQTVHEKMDKFVEPAKDAYENSVSVREEEVLRNLQ